MPDFTTKACYYLCPKLVAGINVIFYKVKCILQATIVSSTVSELQFKKQLFDIEITKKLL